LITLYRRKPLETVICGPWDGGHGSKEEILDFTSSEDVDDYVFWSDDTGYAEVWNVLEGAWIPLPLGHSVVKGFRGEFCPIAPEALEGTYDRIA
jgi:hypothetical protein